MKTCKRCGNRFQKCSGREQDYCSHHCYLAALFPRAGVTVEDIESCHGMTIKDAAYVLGVSYVQLRRRLKQNPDLRGMFPNPGAGRWIAERGYVAV